MLKSLKGIKKVLKSNGFLYLSANYDQHTVLGPTLKSNQKKEALLMQLFNHVAIDKQFKGGVTTGNSHCGSLLPGLCKRAGLKIIEYGSSDWIIPPNNAIPQSKNKKAAFMKSSTAFFGILCLYVLVVFILG